MLEASFADRWESLKTDWVLEREVDLIPIPGSVMIPDFRLVHPDGARSYWKLLLLATEYLQKKFAQVRRAESTTDSGNFRATEFGKLE